MKNIVLDAGTTWSKIIESQNSDLMREFSEYLIKEQNQKKYYIMPSSLLKNINFKFDKATGHMSKSLIRDDSDYENEIIALAKGFSDYIEDNSIILDLGSRDSKWVKFCASKFKDLDWNSSCSSSTGATIEMLLKFYDVECDGLQSTEDKYTITCGIFGLEKIMDDISSGLSPDVAISKFIHGIAYNAWSFAKNPDKLYLSGGFCDNKCFIDSLENYCEVVPLGRFVLSQGLFNL